LDFQKCLMISISGANENWTEQGYNDWRRQVFDDLSLDWINEMVDRMRQTDRSYDGSKHI